MTRDGGMQASLPSPADADAQEIQACLDDLVRYRGLLAREKVESSRSNLLSSIRGMERWLENARRREA